MKTKARILLLDIETSPILASVWGLFDQNIALNQVKKDWHVLAWAAKWLGDPPNKTMYMDQRNAKNIEDDKKILEKIWELIDSADVVIGQNSKKFDIKKLNARFIQHGMPPYKAFKHIDTCQIARTKFGFTSNKLEYMTDKLCVKYKKLKHHKFSGFELWKQCMAGNKAAWKEMEKYNKYDVLSLEELYLKLRPWDNSVNLNVYSDSLTNECSCGSTKFRKHGFRFTTTGKFQAYKCTSCGSCIQSGENLLSKEKRDSLKFKLGA